MSLLFLLEDSQTGGLFKEQLEEIGNWDFAAFPLCRACLGSLHCATVAGRSWSHALGMGKIPFLKSSFPLMVFSTATKCNISSGGWGLMDCRTEWTDPLGDAKALGFVQLI